ncbi:hypothetical protein V6N11_057764 [Hibiscus sabdariffa]|uniref:Uncharacterized protein n=1 Tax=Hibiscus sabdariffa TaxID=183260 RepID=A0ABR2NIN7_9ROSI
MGEEGVIAIGSASSTGNSSQLSSGSVSALGNHNQWFVDTGATHHVTPDATGVSSAEDFSGPEKLVAKEASFSNACKSAALEVLPANFSQLRGHGCASTSSASSQPTNVEPCVSRVISTAHVVVQTSSDQLQMPPAADVTVIGDQHTHGRSAGLTSEGTNSPIRSQIAGVGEPAAAIGADISVETGQEVLNRDSITSNFAGQSSSLGPRNVHSDTANTADRIEAIEDFDAIHIAESPLLVGDRKNDSFSIAFAGLQKEKGCDLDGMSFLISNGIALLERQDNYA